MSSWLRNYFPSKTTLSNLFNQDCDNLMEMSALLTSGLQAEWAGDRESLFKQIDKLEEKGDDFTHKIYLELEKTLFPPINRKHIHALASAIDDIADHIQEATGRIQLYNIDFIYTPINDIATNVSKAIVEIKLLITSVFNIKDADAMRLICRNIKKLEQQTPCSNTAISYTRSKPPPTSAKTRQMLLKPS